MLALGNKAKATDLYCETLHYDNLDPPISGGTQTLQDVCDLGNTTTTNINMTDPATLKTKRINEPGDEVHIRGRVGIGTDPTEPLVEDLEIDGNIQIDTSGLGRIVFYDKAADHEHGEFDADDDGTNGGQLILKTKQDGGTVQTRMVVREDGKVGINTTTPSQFLEVNGTARMRVASFPYRSILAADYNSINLTGTGIINTSTTLGPLWLVRGSFRSTGSITAINIRINKTLPTGNPTISNARVITTAQTSGTTSYNRDMAVKAGATTSDIEVSCGFPIGVPSGTFVYIFVELQEIL